VTSLAASLASAQSVTAGPKGTGPVVYDFDASHSNVGFAVRFMGVSTVHGAFADFAGTLVYDEANPERSTVTALIATSSINTNSSSRDRDLKSEAFFHVEKHPYITFRSETARRTADGFVLEGPLTIRGVTKSVKLPVRLLHPAVKDAWENTRIGFIGTLRINRQDFGVTGAKFWNSEFDPGRMSVADSVDIELMVSAQHANVEKWTAPRADSLIAAADQQGIKTALTQFRTAMATDKSLGGQAGEIMLNRAARKVMQRGKPGDAAQYLALATEINPKSADTFAWLSRAQLAAGDAGAARTSAETAVKLDPLNPAAAEAFRWLSAGK
jgi:polyisoprenoid-binding protein YceI